MSLEEQKLTAEQIAKIQEWLQKKIPPATGCECCGGKGWIIGDFIVTPISCHKNSLQIFGKSMIFPQFFVVCQNCGNIRYFSAYLAGIIEKQEKTNG